MDYIEKAIGKLAVKSNWITEEQLEECLFLQEQEKIKGETVDSLLDILTIMGYLTEPQKKLIMIEWEETNKKIDEQVEIWQKEEMAQKSEEEIAEEAEIEELEEIEEVAEAEVADYNYDMANIPAPNYDNSNYNQNQAEVADYNYDMANIPAPNYDNSNYNQNNVSNIPNSTQNNSRLSYDNNVSNQQISNLYASEISATQEQNINPDIYSMQSVWKNEEDINTPIFNSDTNKDESFNEAESNVRAVIPQVSNIPNTQNSFNALNKTLSFLGIAADKKVHIPGYKILEKIHEDGTTIMYHALESKRKIEVLAVIFKADIWKSHTFQDQLKSHASQLLKLSIPGVPKCLDIAFTSKNGYVIYEWIEGKLLSTLFNHNTPITIQKAIKITIKIAKILQIASEILVLQKVLQIESESPILHGNICPENILISNTGNVLLLCLGLPTSISKNVAYRGDTESIIHYYNSPESLLNEETHDIRSDIYALGSIFYHLLSGRAPWEANSTQSLLNLFTEETIPPIKLYNPEIPDNICAIVNKMLAFDPENRYASYDEIIKKLENPDSVDDKVKNKKKTISSPLDFKENVRKQKNEVTKEEQSKDEAREARANRFDYKKLAVVAVALLIVACILYYNSEKKQNQKIEQITKQYNAIVRSFDTLKSEFESTHSVSVDSIDRLKRDITNIQKKCTTDGIYSITIRKKNIDLDYDLSSKSKEINKWKTQSKSNEYVDDWKKINELKEANKPFEFLMTLKESSFLKEKNQEQYDKYLNDAEEEVKKQIDAVKKKCDDALQAKKEKQAQVAIKDFMTIFENEKLRNFFQKEIDEIEQERKKVVDGIAQWKQEQEQEQQRLSIQETNKVLAVVGTLCKQKQYTEAIHELKKASQSNDILSAEQEKLTEVQSYLEKIQHAINNMPTIVKKIPKDKLSLVIDSKKIKISEITYDTKKAKFVIKYMIQQKTTSKTPTSKTPAPKTPTPKIVNNDDYICTTGNIYDILSCMWNNDPKEEEQVSIAFLAVAYNLYDLADSYFSQLSANNAKKYQRYYDSFQKNIDLQSEVLYEQIKKIKLAKIADDDLNKILGTHSILQCSHIPERKEFSEFVEKFFQKLYLKTTKTTECIFISSYNYDEKQAEKLIKNNPNVEIEKQKIKVGRGTISLPIDIRKFKAISGFVRFPYDSKMTMQIMAQKKPKYLFEIQASGRIQYQFIDSKGLQKSNDLKKDLAYEWLSFAFYIKDNNLHCDVNNEKFSMPYRPKNIDKIEINIPTPHPIELDNLFIAY